jgi:hypothetical protein
MQLIDTLSIEKVVQVQVTLEAKTLFYSAVSVQQKRSLLTSFYIVRK